MTQKENKFRDFKDFQRSKKNKQQFGDFRKKKKNKQQFKDFQRSKKNKFILNDIQKHHQTLNKFRTYRRDPNQFNNNYFYKKPRKIEKHQITTYLYRQVRLKKGVFLKTPSINEIVYPFHLNLKLINEYLKKK